MRSGTSRRDGASVRAVRVLSDGRVLQRLAVSKVEAAGMLGVSVDFFEEHIAPEVKSVRRGRRRLYPVSGIERWLDEAATGEETAA